MKQVFSIFLFIFIYASAYCQDSHYWNLQYGAKATLLGGAVIGSVTDLSATYYNPGAISLFNDPKVILSAKVYQFENIKVIDGAGTNKDLNYSSIAPAPTFVAFNIRIDSTGKSKLAFSVMTRQSMKFQFQTAQITANNDPGTFSSSSSGGFSMVQDFDEIWTGASYSRKLSDVVGVGATTYVAYRNQTTSFQTVIEDLQPDSNIASLLVYRNLKFNNYRTLVKAGIAFNLKPITLGLTITTPSLNILGAGSFGYDNFLSNPDTASKNVYESNFQDHLRAVYNTSWAIGLGAAYWGEYIAVHVSAEWYNAVNEYHPLSLEPFYSQSSGELIQNEINQEFASVINAGIGFEYKINNEVSLAGSFTSDFSANVETLKSNISLTKWNIYHISAGSSFKVGAAEITLGLSSSFAQDEIKQLADIDDPSGIGSALKPTVDVKFLRIKVLFGFVF